MTIEEVEKLKSEISKMDRLELEQYAITLEHLVEQRDIVLNQIPECSVHGKCLPHYSEWIKEHLFRENN